RPRPGGAGGGGAVAPGARVRRGGPRRLPPPRAQACGLLRAVSGRSGAMATLAQPRLDGDHRLRRASPPPHRLLATRERSRRACGPSRHRPDGRPRDLRCPPAPPPPPPPPPPCP